MFINLMKKAVSKLRQRFSEHTDDFLFIFGLVLVAFGLLLGALALAVMVSDSAADYLQQLLREKYEVLKTIGFCIAGIVSIWLALAANKRANAMDATAKNTEEGQRQERLKNAIEHLGHKRDSVRMGGAYELFHLAKDTRDLRQTVMDILCAHIRQTTTGQTTGEEEYKEKHKVEPSEEIQGLLTLLFIEEHDIFEDCSINLQGSYLNGANLRQARLKKANLSKAQLQRAILWRIQLQIAGLREAQLQGANLREAQLQGADLMEAKLQGATLVGARMQGAILYEAQLQRADLWYAQLQRAVLREAQLQGANLYKAQLQRVSLRNAQLQGAIFREAQLQGAVLREARLQRAVLSKAQLQGADLMETQLQGVDLMEARLQGANLSKAQLQGADLRETQLQGVSSHEANHLSLVGFGNEIRDRIGKPSGLTGIIFAGGLKQEDLDVLCEGLSAEKARALREKLRPHVRLEANHELPPNSGAVIGAYTKEEAEQWIAEYNDAMSEVPRAGDS